jgi:hypothetical protein
MKERPIVKWARKDEPITTCRSCPQKIWFKFNTVTGRHSPICADGELEGQTHFANCPGADLHRKPKVKQEKLEL